MKSLTTAVVEQNGVTNRIPNGRRTHAARSEQREMQAARLAVAHQRLFAEAKRFGREALPFANHLSNEAAQVVESFKRQSCCPPGCKFATWKVIGSTPGTIWP